MASPQPLRALTEGMQIPIGNRVTEVSAELSAAFREGDDLITLMTTGELLHVPAEERARTSQAVTDAVAAFHELNAISDTAITAFFEGFANRLEDESTFAAIADANTADVERAKTRGRSTTRLTLTPSMRADMVAGLRAWATLPSGRGTVAQEVAHEGWDVELVRSGLGVIGFVFEGRPNVFADACGVLRSGNAVVFRIGSDALGTAQAIVHYALQPALTHAGLPAGAAVLIESAAHAAGWALFSDPRLSLAVARGSGAAVAQLGTIARQVGTPTSLHGTGGAWMVVSAAASPERLQAAITTSLDRKVCNTLNTLLLPRSDIANLLPVALAGIEAAATTRGTSAKLHVVGEELFDAIPADWKTPRAIIRAEGPVEEPGCELAAEAALGTEWEWEGSPELTISLVDSLEEAIASFNLWSPQFVASLISDDDEEQQQFFDGVNAPFVGNGFTRWVDGQYALGTPELGLSNWQSGRLFGRGGVLSGDSVFTVRTRVRQHDPNVHR